MDDWSLDVINDYCKSLFGGDFLCEMAEGKGRIMIAKKAVKQGNLLFTEPPLHIAAEDEENVAFTRLKSLCQEDGDTFDYDPLWYWAALCSLTEDDLQGGPEVGTLPSVELEVQQRLLALFHTPIKEASDAVKMILQELGLRADPVKVEELLQAWILNCFEHAEEPLAYSAYFASSFISHSCGANAIWTEGDEGLHILRARQDINVGDEITISYLNEQELLYCAEARIKSLKDTKQFTCTCERCAPPSNKNSNNVSVPFLDTCRGFTCKACGKCGIFYCLDKCQEANSKGKGYKGKAKSKGLAVPIGLDGVKCRECGKLVDSSEAERLLEAEDELETIVQEIDEEIKAGGVYAKVMQTQRNKEFLTRYSHPGKPQDAPVGPQHWLCDRLYEHFEKYYNLENCREDQRRYCDLRIEFQRNAYPGLSGALAWTLEEKGDTLLRHLGFGAKMIESDKQFESDLQKQVEPSFKEAMEILCLMFGDEHEYYTIVETKLKNARKYFEKVTDKR